MQVIDLTRLCVRFHHQGKTMCQTPHLMADIISALKDKEYDVRVISVTPNVVSLTVNSQEVCIRAQTSEKTQDCWYTITANGKAVCITPFFTDTVPIHVSDGTNMYPIFDVLYKMWADGKFPTTMENLLDGVKTLTGINATSCIEHPVVYVKVSSFVYAIDIMLETTSES